MRWLSLYSLLMLLFLHVPGSVWANSARIVVFTPSNLTDVMKQVAEQFETETSSKVVLSIAGTASLARQLEAGAPADVFISADRLWIDRLAERGLVDRSNLAPIAANSLVIAARNEVENWVNVKAMLTSQRFAMADPESVPAGRYGKAALLTLGWWDEAKKNALFGENVRVTLKRLSLGEVAAAVVYETDALADPKVKSIFTFSHNSHPPITNWAVVVSESKNSETARRFVRFLKSDAAQTIFKKMGFRSVSDTEQK